MADVRHRNIVEAEKHEPKNFSTATNYSQLIKDENSTSRYLKLQLLEPALDFVDGFVAPPVSPIIGDTYLLLDEGSGTIDAGWDSCVYNDLARFNGVEWIGITPTNGNIIYDLTGKKFHEFKDGVWSVFIPEVPTLYSENGTILAGREATITDTLTFLSGRIGIGQTPNASSILDLSVNDKGLLIPQGNEAQMSAISTPADNLLYQRTDLNGALWRYDLTNTEWVPLSVGYGVIEVIRDSDNGIPSYYTDLQTALETCKAVDSFNKITLRSNITLTSSILINQTGTGLGNAYNFESLTIDFNGFKVINEQADTSSCFSITVPDKTVNFIAPVVIRTNGTGTHYAILTDRCFIQYSGGGYVYCENSIACWHDTIDVINRIVDFNGCTFEAPSGTGLRFDGDGASQSITITNANIISGGTNAVVLQKCNADNLRINHTGGGYAIDCLSVVGIIKNCEIVGSAGGIDLVSGVKLYDNDIQTTGTCLNGSGVGEVYSGRYYSVSSASINNVSKIRGGYYYTESTVCHGTNTTSLLIENATFESNATTRETVNADQNKKYINCIIISNQNKCVIAKNNTSFKDCNFVNRYNNANGHGVDVSNSGTNVLLIDCTFDITNASANGIFSSTTETIKAVDNTFIGATTPINANVTITASTDLGNGNTQI